MPAYYYSPWAWVLWSIIGFVFFSSVLGWGYSYHSKRRTYDNYPNKTSVDILDERYARGEITREEYIRMKSDIIEGKEINTKKSA
jgi:putative membrane protein